MTTKLTPQTKKVIRKVTEALNSSDLSLTVSEIVDKTGMSQTVVKNALSKIENIKQDAFGYYLPDKGGNTQDNGVNTQDDGANIQDKELNTQDPHVSYHDNESSSPDNDEATLINPSAEVTNPSAIDTNTDHDAIINEGVKQISILEEAKDAPYEKLTMPKKPRNKPFTPNLTRGYEVQRDKVKIFLDRKASSKVLTLSLDDLKELVNAVEKSERVA